MRRRPRAEDAPDAPPVHLRTLTAVTTRDKLAWLHDREQWWDAMHDEDSGGWLPWLLEGWEQIGDLPFCGSAGDACGDVECICGAAWREHIQRTTTGAAS